MRCLPVLSALLLLAMPAHAQGVHNPAGLARGGQPMAMPHSLSVGPPPVEHRFEGRFGVAYIRDAGATNGRFEPLAGLRYTLTLNHQLDSGARLSFSFAVQGEHLPGGGFAPRPW
ncbi:MAG: hypothetical protein ACK4LQ_12115 [Pararhodobacter sp.]